MAKSLVIIACVLLSVIVVCLTFTAFDKRHIEFQKYLAKQDYKLMWADKYKKQSLNEEI